MYKFMRQVEGRRGVFTQHEVVIDTLTGKVVKV
jgi:hypothetical protein